MVWVVGVGLVVLSAVLVLLLAALGSAARRADDESERMHEDLEDWR